MMWFLSGYGMRYVLKWLLQTREDQHLLKLARPSGDGPRSCIPKLPPCGLGVGNRCLGWHREVFQARTHTMQRARRRLGQGLRTAGHMPQKAAHEQSCRVGHGTGRLLLSIPSELCTFSLASLIPSNAAEAHMKHPHCRWICRRLHHEVLRCIKARHKPA